MSISQLAPDEPLSPELVLVLSPELRAQALARLGPPVWPRPRPRPVLAPAPPERSFGAALAARVLQLGVVFVAMTAITLTLALVAHAVR